MAHRRAGEIRVEVTVTGGGSGQLSHGQNAIRMQVDRVLGNAVSVLPPDAASNIAARPHPVLPLPSRPIPVFDHVDETHPAVFLSAWGLSLDDLLQALFTAFYTADEWVRPTREQLLRLLRPVQAVVLLGDVDLPAGAVAQLRELLPGCGFVLADPRPGTGSVPLCGRPVDATALHEGRLFTPDDRRLLGLLAAVPGLELSAEELTAISGLPDVQVRLRPWVESRVVTASDIGTYAFAGGELDPVAWQLAHRRAELVASFATWARRNPDAVLVAGGSAEPMRTLQDVARRQRAWPAVIAMGALLDVAYALAGRWDAWRSCLHATLEAARAVGDQAAEAMALHQLGTQALGRGDLATARAQLGAAVELRLALGETAAAGITRQNLALITDRPPSAGRRFAGALARIPMGVKVVAVLIPLLGGLAVVGMSSADSTPKTSLDPHRLAFTDQTVDRASPPQVIRLGNVGTSALHVDDVAVSGPNHGAFTLVDTSCVGAVPADGECTATVVFIPANPGEHQASLSWRIREIPGDVTSPLVGTAVAAPPRVPSVVGFPLDAAQQAVTAVGLRPGVVTQKPSPQVPQGTVLDQTPGAGADVARGGPVDLVVSRGPEPVAVPVLVGQSQTAAAARLDALGLQVGRVERRADLKIAAGSVVACNPGPGTQVPRGSAVALVVSSGLPRVTVPSVVGRPLATARARLGQGNLTVGAVSLRPSATVGKGLVISSSPAAGSQVVAGARVSLVVSSGAPRTVPTVVGLSVAQATAKLQAAGLKVVAVDAAGRPVKAGTVVRSNPAAGRPAPVGGRVQLTVQAPAQQPAQPPRARNPVLTPNQVGG